MKNSLTDYHKDRTWSDRYLPQVKEILQENLNKIVQVKIAGDKEDTTNATDMVIQLESGDVAVRIRRPDCKFRDLTLRSSRESGTETELSKIKKGLPRWYLYGWTNDKQEIYEWILVDLNKVREKELWEEKRERPNHDGTWFIAIPTKELYKEKCLVSYKIDSL